MHELHIKNGGYSSIHMHRMKYNYFYVLYGSLQVNLYVFKRGEYKVEKRILCTPGSFLKLRPYAVHQFEVLKGVHAFEWYTSPLLVLKSDIVRFSSNGVDESVRTREV